MAQHVEDRGLRENQPNKAEVGLIERHFVGEPARALACCPELTRALKIVVAQVVEPFELIAEPEFR